MIYKPEEALQAIMMETAGAKVTAKGKTLSYYEIPAAFDIETTSYRTESGSKAAVMYVWQLAIGKSVIIGRTWADYEGVIDEIANWLDLSPNKRLVVYVHNLSFEFQFLSRRQKWAEVFASAPHEPMYACTDNGIEYRCSYLLSGLSLAKVGKGLRNPVRKMEGDLDYTLKRHSDTPLTDEEIGYCAHDVLILTQYISELMEDEGSITQIPLTKTGYVRRHVRNKTLGSCPQTRTSAQWAYYHLMRNLTIEPDEYRELKRAFQGGFTHANPWRANRVWESVSSYDFTSSYPTVMISEKYPMSKGRKVSVTTLKQLEDLCAQYCVMFDLHLEDVQNKTHEHYISTSRCHPGTLIGAQEDNGRVVYAQSLSTTVTDVDYGIIKETYEYSKISVANVYVYKRDYLPSSFVRTILDLYKDKTQLKGIKGMEQEYMVAKGMLNSLYGMCVTDVARDEIDYDGEQWITYTADIAEEMQRENASNKRCLYYPWGVWVTAYARRALWSGILACGSDYIYSDTDSIKIMHADKHKAYIKQYNDGIIRRLKIAMAYHGFDPSDIAPTSKDGVEHPLGVWDYEGTYDHFKTLGAKRYLVETGGEYALTVAGLGKVSACKYIASLDDPFGSFSDGLIVPAEHTGKLTHTYIDHEIMDKMADYTGRESYVHEYSAVHLEAAPYVLTMADKYTDFLQKVMQS